METLLCLYVKVGKTNIAFVSSVRNLGFTVIADMTTGFSLKHSRFILLKPFNDTIYIKESDHNEHVHPQSHTNHS